MIYLMLLNVKLFTTFVCCRTILAKVGCIDIKQKAGRLSHLDDPDRLKSLLAQTLTTEQYSCWMIDPKSLASFSHDRQAQNFTRIFMSQRAAVVESEVPKIQQPSKVARDESEIEQMVTLQFYNCLTKDRIHALPIYMSLLTVSCVFLIHICTFDEFLAEL